MTWVCLSGGYTAGIRFAAPADQSSRFRVNRHHQNLILPGFTLTLSLHLSILTNFIYKAIMSMFGLGRQQSSEQKIAAAEQEMEMVSDMFNKYAFPKHLETHAIQKLFPDPCIGESKSVLFSSASRQRISSGYFPIALSSSRRVSLVGKNTIRTRINLTLPSPPPPQTNTNP